MPWRNRVAAAVFVVGASVNAVFAYRGVRDVLGMFSEGGGVFGSSGDLGELLLYLLPVAVNSWMAAMARERRPAGRVLQRAYRLVLLGMISIVVLFLVAPWTGAFAHGVNGLWQQVIVSFFLVGALWLPVQGLFGSAFVATLVAAPTKADGQQQLASEVRGN